MTKSDAVKLIDDHKNKLMDPVEMLHWTWLRVLLLHMDDDAWDEAVLKACEVLTR